MILILLIVIILLAALAGNLMSFVERPDYKVVASNGDIEIRDYAPLIVAEVQVSGERKQAINEGFKILADYIFGNNTANKKMEMTAPVTNEQSEKMAMTAPVMQEEHQGEWKIRFVMPKKYNMETLPQPNVKAIHLVQMPARRFAVIRFSGLADDESIKEHTKQLQDYVADQQLNPVGTPSLAFYNPPWTLPFLRRNEVMIEVKGL